ncbi:error-prone DNA polymerase [Oceanicella actignis]|uniref:error-prone DNA polymerase n=1 Tax=Oceanicella actignis TaxID=1189325 RepID=UPI0011E7E5FE|nr:error-prone DNA polymerase [Oceanicella actignis]TYO91509.1 error-prone DNA polymerase [Oceanicella actignis]
MAFAELCATSNYTFLVGASHPEEYVLRAARMGLEAIAIADRNSVAGVVRAHRALRECAEQGLRPPRLIPAARLVLEDGETLVALPRDRAAWGRLTRLLTLGKRRARKGGCILRAEDVAAHAQGMFLLLTAPPETAQDAQTDPAGAGAAAQAAQRWARRLPGQTFLAAAPRHDGRDRERLAALAAAAEEAGAPLVATADPIMHHGARRRLADVLRCIREKTVIDRLGRRALRNAERRLRAEAEMRRIFADHERAVDRAAELARACAFSLDQLRYEYPDEVAGGEDPQTRLERLTRQGLARRYPQGVPARVQAMAERELALIARLGYARYFLTVRDLVEFAESRGILCQGRGSAANSVVCYALRITAVAPEVAAMVFERFISEARDEPPDIDVDFEHERREEVIQHIYARYGRSRAGLCATVIRYRARRAVREVGKAMGLSEDVTGALASQVWSWSAEGVDEARLREIGLDPADRRLRQTLELCRQIIGFPRHLSQHTGGFVITRGRLDELVPIENAAMEDRTVIEWDKDDIDALGILKVDVLALGMLTCIRKCFDLIAAHGGPRWTLATLPPEDPAVYDMLCRADSLGVFQVESRAQMNFLPRMKPRCFYDLVIQVAIIRPGPIQGDMVHPYLRRRRGEEPVSFPSDALGEVLARTLGVPLFQEQAMQIAVIGAGFSPAEADRLRRSLAAFRKSGTVSAFRERFVEGMTARGYARDFAERCFSQIEGFGEYGFPESHAASFALLVYASAWLKRHHPAAFACALLNAQPMGFYAPAQIVRDARAHGVEVRPVCVNASYWDNTLEPSARSAGGLALRLGFRQARGVPEEDARWIAAARGNGYAAPEDLRRRAGIGAATLERLAEADAFAALGLTRRQALWQVRALRAAASPLPLFDATLEGEGLDEPAIALPPVAPGEEVAADYAALRLSLRRHPLELLRPRLAQGMGRAPAPLPAAALDRPPPGARVHAAGLVLVRQRPGTAKGVVFLTLEDETGVVNVVVWPRVYERFRRAVIAGRLLRVRGRIQRDGEVTHLVADRVEDLSALLDELAAPPEAPASSDAASPAARRASPASAPRGPAGHPRAQARRLFPAREFR